MELLSPAGNLLAAYAAFKGGADAVYIGGKSFSARASATNFTNEEIKEIVEFAHSIGKKVYVTLNTLIFQDEFMEAVNFANYLYTLNIDGLIVQDLGLAHYLNKTIPGLPLNASTQLNCHNLKQAKALINIGFKRIVLAREADIETVKAVKALGVEVEVFGHGALCVSYSGNCLLSSYIGDRSGNRGRCAQPCRMKYDLVENNRVLSNSFAISTKDLMTIDHLEEFIEAGVDSLKIEGRLKSNEYIYSVSKAYRHAIDTVINNKDNKDYILDKEELKKTFNRQFTKGYIFGETPFTLLNTSTSSHQGELIGKVVNAYKNRIGIKLNKEISRLDGIRFNNDEQFGLTIEKMFFKREPVEIGKQGQIIELTGIENPERLLDLEVIRTKDYKLTKNIENTLKDRIKVGVNAHFIAKTNKQISIKVSFNGKSVTVYGENALAAEGNGTSYDRIIEQLSKTGDYPYYFENINVEMDKCFIPISFINNLRNNALEALRNELTKVKFVDPLPYNAKMQKFELMNQTKVIAETLDQENIVNDFGLVSYSHLNNEYKNQNRIIHKGAFNHSHDIINFIIDKEIDNYLIASQYCNITNSYALDCYYEHGFNECILSTELDYFSINELISDYKNRHNQLPNVGLVCYGKIDMMILKSCPIGTYYNNENIHCERCHKKRYELVDRVGEHYHLIGDSNCNIRILNNRPTFLLDKIEEINCLGITNMYILLTDEGKEKVSDILTHYFDQDIEYDSKNHTRGHYIKRPL